VWDAYKEFLFRGNLLDLAVAFILGAAFSTVVSSLSTDVIGQMIAAIVGQPDFTAVVITVNGTGIGLGAFLTALVNFVIVASVLFLIVRAASRFQRRPTEATPAPDSDEVVLLREIRDLLGREPLGREGAPPGAP
jgi:large conductance mechanosensitive channel